MGRSMKGPWMSKSFLLPASRLSPGSHLELITPARWGKADWWLNATALVSYADYSVDTWRVGVPSLRGLSMYLHPDRRLPCASIETCGDTMSELCDNARESISKVLFSRLSGQCYNVFFEDHGLIIFKLNHRSKTPCYDICGHQAEQLLVMGNPLSSIILTSSPG